MRGPVQRRGAITLRLINVGAGLEQRADRRHVAIVYGAGMSEGNGHVPENLPILIVGGASGRIAGGRHLKFTKGTPLANFHLSLLDRFGVRIDQHGNSTGPVSLD